MDHATDIELIELVAGRLPSARRQAVEDHLLRCDSCRQRRDENNVEDFRGSSHIVSIARSALALSIIQAGPQPDRNGPRRLELVKTNLGRYPPPLGVAFVGDGAGEDKVLWVQYGEPPQPYRPPTQTAECAVWLVELLGQAQGPLQPRSRY